MNSPARICVVGSTNVDLTFRTSRLPKAGETLAGRSLHVGIGGKGANQAVAAARLGADVAFVACVGNDSFGADAIGHFQAEGINHSHVRRARNQPTGTAAIVVDDDAENSILIVAGANAELTPDDVGHASDVIQKADAILCQLETPLEATLEAFRLARAAGTLTVLTPAPVVALPNELLQLCDLCVPNRTEIEVLAEHSVRSFEDAHAAADSMRARGVNSVAVTMGSDGALVVDEEGPLRIPVTAVDAIDTTGAGDAFTAALVVSLAEGLPFRAAAHRAALVAAITVTRIGTQAAFPHRTEVNDRMVSGL